MNIIGIEKKNNVSKTIITHFSVWLLYLGMQFVWRFDSYTIYDFGVATTQVMTWACVFYYGRLYIYPKYLGKNKLKLALGLFIAYPIFQIISIIYINYFIVLAGGEAMDTILHIRRGLFWYFNMSFVAFGFTYYDELGKEKEKNQIIETKLRETKLKLKIAELENLKAQFNPHFLFNALWYIYGLVYDTGNENATKAVELLSDMMKYSMQNRQINELVPIEDELKYAHNFIELQRLRTPRIKVDYQVKGELEGIEILPLVLLSFIENACKHGKLDEAENPLRVHMNVEDRSKIVFWVKNKISHLGKDRSSGIGLENVKNRLTTAYGDNFKLNVENTGEFYTSELVINR
jgi:two-component system, LytTR family, sensor kinase